MDETRRWPEPPIVLDNREPIIGIELPRFSIPTGYAVVEGHKRAEIAMTLIRRGELDRDLPICVLTYWAGRDEPWIR